MNRMDTVCTEYSMYWIQYVRTDGQYDKMEIARNNQKEILGIQNSVIEIKNAFDGFSGDRKWLDKESPSWGISQLTNT